MLDSTPFNHPDTGDAATTLKSAAARSACVGSGRPLEEDLDARSVDVLSKPSFLHRGQLIIVNEGSTTRDYLGEHAGGARAEVRLSASDTCLTCAGVALLVRPVLSCPVQAFERNYLSWMKLVATCMVISGALIIRLQVGRGCKETSLRPA